MKLLNRVLIIFTLLAIFAAQAFATNITVASTTINDWSYGDSVSNVSNPAMTVSNGRVTLSAPPTDAANQTVGMTSDPRVGEVRYTSKYATLALALAASSGKTLEVDSAVAAPANVTIPADVSLRFTRQGYLTIAGGVVTILGEVDAPRAHIFRGTGTVKFTAAYPEAFYPEWWGAVGDGVTDDLPAFNAMLTSMMRVNTDGLPYGGRIALRGGRYYYLSDTLHIRRSVHMTGMGGRDSGGFTVAENKVGIVTHSLSTFDGVYAPSNGWALNAVLENFSLNAVPGATTNSTVSVRGRIVTRTAGTAFDQTATMQDGNTILINGHDYEIGSIDSASQITLADNWPVMLRQTGATRTLTHIGFQLLSPDWVGASITVGGVSYTISAVKPLSGLYGYGATITLSGGAVPAVGDYTGKIVGGFGTPRTGLAARMNIYHGLDLRAGTTVRNLQITGFHGNGVNANSTQRPSFNLGVEPNANHELLERIWSDFNSGNGFYLKGVNSNAATMTAFSARGNHGVGVYDNSFLGNTHVGHHLLSNWL
jgi:hypothetical protein